MQIQQRLNEATNVIDFFAPASGNDATVVRNTLDKFLELPARESHEAGNRTIFARTNGWASRWEDASFAAMGAAGLAGIVLALRVLW